MRLGTVLKKYRAMEELTTRELAEKIGVPHPTLNRLENGKDITAQNFALFLVWLAGEEDAERSSDPPNPE